MRSQPMVRSTLSVSTSRRASQAGSQTLFFPANNCAAASTTSSAIMVGTPGISPISGVSVTRPATSRMGAKLRLPTALMTSARLRQRLSWLAACSWSSSSVKDSGEDSEAVELVGMGPRAWVKRRSMGAGKAACPCREPSALVASGGRRRCRGRLARPVTSVVNCVRACRCDGDRTVSRQGARRVRV